MDKLLQAAMEVIDLPWSTLHPEAVKGIAIVLSMLAFILTVHGLSGFLGAETTGIWRVLVIFFVGLVALIVSAAAAKTWLVPLSDLVEPWIWLVAAAAIVSLLIIVPVIAFLYKMSFIGSVGMWIISLTVAWGISIIVATAWGAVSHAREDVGEGLTRKANLEKMVENNSH